MNSTGIRLFASSVGCAMALLASQAASARAHERVLHAFGNGEDGNGPYDGVIDVNGVLYGTTAGGGASGDGAVFAVDAKTGAETVAYSFCSQPSCTDGTLPVAGLINVKGALYGVAQDGGRFGSGTLFALDPRTGKEKVLYSFCSAKSCADGAYPTAGLVAVNGTLFGTTVLGGNSNDGTVFGIDARTGKEIFSYSFCSAAKCADGRYPNAALIEMKGTLYGTTFNGGLHNWGAVFALDPSTGAETVLYSFCSEYNCTDGVEPYAGLIEEKGVLYGATEFGGANCLSDGGCGTAFALDPATGSESVLHSFCSRPKCSDGAYPEATLIDVKGKLYATTNGGGDFNSGTIFALDPESGAETVLYSFCHSRNCTDGAYPAAGLIDVNGTLYGTTEFAGTYGFGTVFAFAQ